MRAALLGLVVAIVLGASIGVRESIKVGDPDHEACWPHGLEALHAPLAGHEGQRDPPSGAADPGGRRRLERWKNRGKVVRSVAKWRKRWRPHRDSKYTKALPPNSVMTHAKGRILWKLAT